ncbi:MAG: TaqI-like C-terminal specificity domain-containing protein [Nitrospirota bacterium]
MKPHRNRGLFSNYYLDELLPKEDEFKISISEVKSVHEKVKAIWDKSRFEALNEPQLRKHFLDKVFEILGWIIDVEPPTPSGEWSKHADYALFYSKEDLKIAQKVTEEEYFKKSPCIGEAKRWGRPLDRKLKEEKDPFEVQNPSLQISRYLWLTGVKWGILTDGKYWRLYERETSKRLDIFYEINLEDLIESGSPEDFRYFYLLFRKDAFPEFIEKVYKESVDYAEAVGEELKENVYQALKVLSQGFLKTPGNNLSEANLNEIHDNSLIFLYRLLFILYAEYRDLLPLGSNKLYTESYSLDAFKKEVANRLDRNEPIATSTHGYWNKLKELFEIINKGNRELDVPPYNGGLFEPEKHDFLEKHRVGDLYIAKAVDLLSRSKDKAYIDYGSLEIRHLGSIYEGLLEYKLKIVDQDIVPVKNKGKEIFVSLQEAEKQKKKIREDEKIRAGEIYLVTDKGERKATGSYYTPDYIVKYIVENTIGPLVEEKRKKVSEKVEELREKIKGSKGINREGYKKELRKVEGSLIDEILSLKVLDPAMGSGHFLVEATDFLARELLKIVSGEPLEEHSKEMVIREALEPYGLKEPEEEDIRWARREVVEKCIFGVDLNPMAVELAKLSLWLYTVAKNRPLNFLDHHLRCGNSLIGARIEDLAGLPKLKKKKTKEGIPQQLGLFESIFKEKINILLGAFAQIESLPSDTVEQIREKEKLYHDFRKIVSRFQDVADVWTSNYFGNEIDFGNYQSLQDNLRSSEEEWRRLSQEHWFKKAKEITDEKKFFHWELEFPEVFFEGHRRKENPGFDVVVGNPPYINIMLIEDEALDYFLKTFNTARRRFDLYVLFGERSLRLIKKEGYHSFIVPDKILSETYGTNFRKLVLSDHKIEKIFDVRELRVFPDSAVKPTVYVVKNEKAAVSEIIVEMPTNEDMTNIKRWTIPQQDFLMIPEYRIRLDWSTDVKILVEKIKSISFPLSRILYISWGAQPGEADKFFFYGQEPDCRNNSQRCKAEECYSKGGLCKPLIKGSVIQRYSIYYENAHILYDAEKLHRPAFPELFENEKIVIREVSGEKGLIAAYDAENYYTDHSLINCIPKYYLEKLDERVLKDRGIKFVDSHRTEKDVENKVYDRDTIIYSEDLSESKRYKLKFIIALINSSLIGFYYQKYVSGELNVFPEHVRTLRIPYVNFTTPENKREKVVQEAIELYNSSKYDDILKWAGFKLSNNINDTIHDFLVYLVGQMNMINTQKNKEIKGLLTWLESQLKIQSDKDGNKGIEALTGKTQIKNYIGDYQKGEENLLFDYFWKILEKNSNRIQANLKSRELYENIKSEYEKSLSKLLPLKEKIRKTDWLIDQIVYKLYGLTEEEIKIVEGQKIK